MTKLSPAIVLVKDIRSNTLKQNFDAEKLNIAARLILDIEGIISPIIVSREGVEHYRVIQGDFEYHAAMRAREIDPIRGETIDAYIVNTETQETIEKQIQVFRNSDYNQVSKPVNSTESGGLETLLKSCLQPVMDKLTHLQPIMDRLTAIESQLSIQDVPVEIPQQEHQPQKPVEDVEDIVQQEPVQIDAKLETLTPLFENKQEAIEKIVSEPTHVNENVVSETPELIPAYLKLINELPSNLLAEKLKDLSIRQSPTKAILENRPFASEKALSSIKGVAAKTIEKLQTLQDDISEPMAVETQSNKQTAPPPVQKESSTMTDAFLSKLNQMDKIELFFKVKRATNLNDNKINQLIDNRPYQALSDIKAVNKKHLEKIRPLLTE
ncbi:hypothetical protein [Candidatus Albibeggiatoa sp. nov. BB20]|uniref:hypothetical protein n=1 Tax=Candidatus Albibeggiatoa sp. nov. BB20 TaxID=3162723 RepID=UPI003365771A